MTLPFDSAQAETIIVEVTRADRVESEHHVAACAIEADGDVLYAAGAIDVPVYLRSAAKPFIAAAAIEAGVDRAFGLDSREIAVMAASHAGEPMHVAAAQSILNKIGMSVSDLQCGVHWPYDEKSAEALRAAGEKPTALHNNCSGKHAGILALCKVIGADTASYLSPENPAQRRILEFCARLSDDDATTWPIGIDGCGIPVYATSLRNAALSFARFASPMQLGDADARALLAVRDAMVEHPRYVAGAGQLDTELMLAAKGAIASKAGAEGVHGVAAIAAGCGYVSKVLDGAARARGPSTIAVLRRLGAIDADQMTVLAPFARPPVYNRAGKVVGEIRAVV